MGISFWEVITVIKRKKWKKHWKNGKKPEKYSDFICGTVLEQTKYSGTVPN
jgi:hypothetical protein